MARKQSKKAKKSANKVRKAKKKPLLNKKVGPAKKKQVAKKKKKVAAMATTVAISKEAKARALTLQALGFGPLPDSKTLASLLINDAPSKAGLAQRLRALGVNINDGPVILCKTVGDVVQAVKARI